MVATKTTAAWLRLRCLTALVTSHVPSGTLSHFTGILSHARRKDAGASISMLCARICICTISAAYGALKFSESSAASLNSAVRFYSHWCDPLSCACPWPCSHDQAFDCALHYLILARHWMGLGSYRVGPRTALTPLTLRMRSTWRFATAYHSRTAW